MQAVLAGATGLVGSQCLKFLLESSRYDMVSAVVRRPLGMSHPRLREEIVDFERLGSLSITPGGHVLCALGTTMKKAGSQEAFRRVDFDHALALARRASEAGAASFVLVSSVGADAHSSNFYLRVKGELESAVSILPLRAIHIFRPSFLMGNREETRAGESVGFLAARALGWAMVGPLSRYRPVESEDVARAMTVAAASPETGRRVYHFNQIRAMSRIGT